MTDKPRLSPAWRESGSDAGRRAPGQQAPIGVFDSGLGGLTVVSALLEQLPHERIVYLGDTARVPYGTKSAATVVRYALQVARFLVHQDVKYLVAACNTASAHAVPELRRAFNIPVMGVVEPGAEVAARQTTQGQIGVVGTLGTVSSRAYQRALQRIRPDLVVFSQACPLFVPLAEEGWSDHPVAGEVARHYLAALRQQTGDLDTLVLGCTHYPLLSEAIASAAAEVYGHPLTLIDSATAVARAVAKDLEARGLACRPKPDGEAPSHRFFVTDESRFDELAPRFLGRPVASAEHADI